MGQLSPVSDLGNISARMKTLLAIVALFALVAMAFAEPEPEPYRGYGYGGYGRGYGYGGYGRGYGGYGRGYYGRKKREAEADAVAKPEAEADADADAEADADAAPYYYGGYYGRGYGYGGYGYGYPYGGYGYGYYRGKRSADAEVNNVNRVSGGSPFPSYTAAWPGATVSVNHGKRKRSAEPHGYFGYYGHPFYYHPYAYFHGPAAKPAAIDGDAYTAEWPGATVSVDHIAKRSAELVDNVNQVSGSSPFPSYTAAWPGATVSVDHGK